MNFHSNALKPSLRIMSYNIHFGGRKKYHHILAVIRYSNPDLCLITEATQEDVIRNLSGELGMDYLITKKKETRLAILTRAPILSYYDHCWPDVDRPLIEVELDINNRSFMIFGIHLPCHYFRRSEQKRVRVLSRYLDYIITKKEYPHIILGDFNAVSPGDRFITDRLPIKERIMLWYERGRIYTDAISIMLQKGYIDCFRYIHPDEDGFTLPVKSPQVRLDYIFANTIMKEYLSDCYVVTEPDEVHEASDHYPVMALFSIY